MPRVTTADLAATIAAMSAQMADLTATVAALSAPTAAPVAPVAAVHIGPSGKPDGRRYGCTCGRMFRSDGLSPNASPNGGLAGHIRTAGAGHAVAEA